MVEHFIKMNLDESLGNTLTLKQSPQFSGDLRLIEMGQQMFEKICQDRQLSVEIDKTAVSTPQMGLEH